MWDLPYVVHKSVFLVQLSWHSRVRFQAGCIFCPASCVLSVWLDGLEVDGLRGTEENCFSLLRGFWYYFTGMRFTSWCPWKHLTSFKIKGRREQSSIDAKIWKYSKPFWNEAKDSEGWEGKQKEWEKKLKTKVKMKLKILMALRLKMCISKQGEILSCLSSFQKASWVLVEVMRGIGKIFRSLELWLRLQMK